MGAKISKEYAALPFAYIKRLPPPTELAEQQQQQQQQQHSLRSARSLASLASLASTSAPAPTFAFAVASSAELSHPSQQHNHGDDAGSRRSRSRSRSPSRSLPSQANPSRVDPASLLANGDDNDGDDAGQQQQHQHLFEPAGRLDGHSHSHIGFVPNTSPTHVMPFAVAPDSELGKDQDLLDSMLLIIPSLEVPAELDAHRAEDALASAAGIDILTFGQLSSLANIGGCSQSLVAISRNIALLYNTTSLQLCCNQLTEIPAEIGYLKNLVYLSVAHNNIASLPDTIGLLSKLVDLKLNHNKLSSIPDSIGALSKLTTLNLASNNIAALPSQIGALKSLRSLDVSNNPIEYLPAELGRLKDLARIGIQNCPLLTEPDVGDAVLPSLKELAARTLMRSQMPILAITQPDIKDYLRSVQECSFCGGPYFEAYCTYVRIIDRGGIAIPLLYRMCCRHWSNEQERIACLFAPLPSTAPSPIASTGPSPTTTPPDSPDARRRRGSAVSLNMSYISKTPSLPSMPTSLESAHPRKSSASQLFRKTALIASGMRASRSLSFLSSSAPPSTPPTPPSYATAPPAAPSNL